MSHNFKFKRLKQYYRLVYRVFSNTFLFYNTTNRATLENIKQTNLYKFKLIVSVNT